MTKQEIRNIYLKKRKELSQEQVQLRSKVICKQFFDRIDLSEVKILHCFLPIKKFNEVNTWLLVNRVWEEHPHIQVATSITNSDKLAHVIIHKNTLFEEDKWGIPIPVDAQPIGPNKIDLVVTPLLAFDRRNHRVGYGKGYYDKFFSECREDTQKIGVSLFPALDELIDDVDANDVPLDSVIC